MKRSYVVKGEKRWQKSIPFGNVTAFRERSTVYQKMTQRRRGDGGALLLRSILAVVYLVYKVLFIKEERWLEIKSLNSSVQWSILSAFPSIVEGLLTKAADL